jgi:APA family basic amino acid/polyamine antiporter
VKNQKTIRERAGRPALGFAMCLALVIGNMIGTGVYLLPASLAPLGWNAVFGWIVTISGALCLAYVFARLSAAFPRTGGPYAFTREAFGDGPAFAVAWSYWISVWVTNAAIAVAAVSYLTSFFPAVASITGLPGTIAIGFLWLFTILAIRSVRGSGAVQLITTIIKIIPLIAVALIAFAVVAGDGGASLRPYRASDINAGAITAAGAITLWAMLGFEAATVPADKIRDAPRTIPRATLIGALITGLIYLVVVSGVALLLPVEQASSSSAPLADFVARYWGTGPALLIALFASVSALGALNGWVLIQGELPLAMARDGMFPRWFAATSASGISVRGQIVSSVLATILIIVNYSRSLSELFLFMALLATVATLVAYLFSALAALRLLGQKRMPPSRLLMIVALLGAIYSLWTFYGAGVEATGWGAALLASGIPVYWLMRRSSREAAAGPAALPE